MPAELTRAQAALEYAAAGILVFPIFEMRGDGTCACGDVRCKSPGKHPRVGGGLKAASHDEDTVRGWWARWPEANVGIRTGAESGLVVIDIDAAAGGYESFAALEARLGPLDTAAAQTGGGGVHLFLLHPGDRKIKNSASKLAPGVDVRGDGGYVVAPPSNHRSGGAYAWITDDDVRPIPIPPAWLAALESAPSQGLRDAREIPTPGNRRQAREIPIAEGEDPYDPSLVEVWRGRLREYGSADPAKRERIRGFGAGNCPVKLGEGRNQALLEVVSVLVGYDVEAHRERNFGQLPAQRVWAPARLYCEVLRTALERWAADPEATKDVEEELDIVEGMIARQRTQFWTEVVEPGMRSDRRLLAGLFGGKYLTGAPAGEEPTEVPRPTILVGPDLHRVVAEALAALPADAELFQRGGGLVRVTRDFDSDLRPLVRRDVGAPRIEEVPVPWTAVKLSAVARFQKIKKSKKGGREVSDTMPPPAVVAAVASAGTWPGIRKLTAVVETPTLRADGSLLATPGYDPLTGILLAPAGQVAPLPEKPTLADALAARDRLCDLLVDFPFASLEHLSACLAALLTPFLRWAFDGPAPLFLIDANVRGSGKSLLAATLGTIVTGRIPPCMTFPANEEERRKRITAIALQGDPLVWLDNVEGTLGGESLNAALTSTAWRDRILGASEMSRDLPLYLTWYATANNASLGADTPRRTVHVRLLSEDEHPERRGGFRHPDLLAHTRRVRPQAVADCLTIGRYWFQAGCPSHGLPAMGSFEGWRAVREIVVALDLPDPVLSQEKLAARSDRDADELHQLLLAIEALAPRGEWVTATELLRRALTQRPSDAPALRDVFAEFLPTERGAVGPSPKQLAGRLRKHADRIADGRRIEFRADRTGVGQWRVYEIHTPLRRQEG